MKVIALEEHYGIASIKHAASEAGDELAKLYELLIKTGKFKDSPTGFPEGIYDLGDGRIAAMDAAGIDVSILSYPPPNAVCLDPSVAIPLCKEANDTLAATIAKYPDRLGGFATLPVLDPAAAARELERAVRDLGFHGALLNSNINGRQLDDKFFWPVFECAEALGVPIYLHPHMPPKPVRDAYYSGFAPDISGFFAIAGAGWHIDVGVHAFRLILAGVFDRFPKLQVICGHNFEIIASMAWRMDYSFPVGQNGGLKKTIKEYLRENFYGGILAGEYVGQKPGEMDPSWSLAYSAYQCMANTVGVDRVVFTTDWPYGDMKAARMAFDRMPVCHSDKEKLAHLNAERLLGLGKD